MTLLDRYRAGVTQEVHQEISLLAQSAFQPAYFNQVDLVLKETFKRTASNLHIIYQELKKRDYRFTQPIQYDWQRPLSPPLKNTDALLSALQAKTKQAGHLPLSLMYFYNIVGSCNFCWDWKADPEIPWEGADPIEIPTVSSLLEMVEDDLEEGDDLIITGDYLHKDNISGSNYSIRLTPDRSVDSLFLDYNIPFIEYLRLTFNNCGFTRADQCNHPGLTRFCNSVRPLLAEI